MQDTMSDLTKDCEDIKSSLETAFTNTNLVSDQLNEIKKKG